MKSSALLVLVLACAGAAHAAACSPLTSGNWSAVTWSGCTGAGGLPGTGDNVALVSTSVALDTSVTIQNLGIYTGGQLVTDGHAHTLTLTGTQSTGQLSISSGCTSATSPCISPWALDTSAGSSGQELTIDCPNITSQNCIQENNTAADPLNVNLVHAVIQAASATSGLAFSPASNGYNHYFDHLRIVGTSGMQVTAVTASPSLNSLNLTNTVWTGGTGGALALIAVSPAGSCTIDNLVVESPAANVAAVRLSYTGLSSSTGGCTSVSNLAGINDPAGNYAVSLVQGNRQDEASAVTVDTVLEYGYNPAGSGFAVVGLNGATSPVTIRNVAGDNVVCVSQAGGSTVTSGTVCRQQGDAQAYQGGLIFYAGNITSSNDSVIVYNSNAGNIGLFLGIDDPVTSTATHDTVIMYNGADTGYSQAFGIGEGIVPAQAVTNASLSNSIALNGTVGIASFNPNTTCVSTGTGGVGIFNNLAYNATYNWQTTGANCGTTHPDPAYGDLSMDPWMYPEASTRTFANCADYLLNAVPGSSTNATVFDNLFGLWNDSSTLRMSDIYACMKAPIVPQRGSLATAGAGGTYVGSAPPNILAAGAAAQ